LTSMPGFDAIEVQPGPAAPGITVPTRVARMDIYLNSSVLISAEDVYAVVSTIHRNWAQLQQALPAFRTVAADEIVPVRIGHPWHEGAVRYFREAGLWTEAHEQQQQALLRGTP